MTDAKLIQNLKNGDKNTLNELYQKYSRRLYVFIYGYLKTEADTLDLIQEVFIKIWINRQSIKPDSQLDSYIFTIAKNTIISAFRKKISEQDYYDYLKNTVVTNSIATESQVNYDLLSEAVGNLVSKLPSSRQHIYRLSKEQGYSNKQIASELQISIKTVEDHMTKARKFIQDNLQEYGLLAALFISLFLV
ncbi:RNA polymerase sigma factor [Mangrovibacterium diazotrophicum]|uniref:RNA polymerase sigma factor n=1 Tax=Mangrovibacterium diazotrophicum TaxID=1261403 RepID=A0A419W9A3_9BACT|nr:RNA polymerase sigma-70 factor [Mangrovibacterium diazotrophicum]RKD92029.1 RNA polymerase sigma-70 factor (ECF subfamily) [Mangrovibacterium diazotrophicum]